MCELFCLSARRPTRATFSLRHFAAHGSPDYGRNVDGWGVAFHEGRDVRLYKEPEPAGNSAWLDFIERRSHPARLLISHVRRATVGSNILGNTQPFVRELGGRMHLFAHNGGFSDIVRSFEDVDHRFRPVGDTDSERAFCLLLERLAPLWGTGASPGLASRRSAVEAFAAEMRPLGIANFLYSDGEYVFAHGHRRTQADGVVAPPGLWVRHRHRATPHHMDAAASGVTIHEAAAGDEGQDLALVASVPVTAGAWRALEEGEVVVLSEGQILKG